MAVLHDGVVAVSNLREFFRESIDSAIDNRHVRVDPHTSHYVVNLLTLFARSEKFYNEDNEHCGVRPVEVFRELARKFQSLVDVLNEVRDGARCSTDTDVLRTYEIWRKKSRVADTGSKVETAPQYSIVRLATTPGMVFQDCT